MGRWILDHQTFPRVDIYSFTKAGEPWISTSWLAQILYAETYELAGWAGPVILAAASVAITFALLAFLQPSHSLDLRSHHCARGSGAFSVSPACAYPRARAAGDAGLGQRPRVGEREPQRAVFLAVAVDCAVGKPSRRLHPRAYALIAPFAFDALWNVERSQRRSLALRWVGFGICAVVDVLRNALWMAINSRLADNSPSSESLLHLISEWSPTDFGSFSVFEACLCWR